MQDFKGDTQIDTQQDCATCPPRKNVLLELCFLWRHLFWRRSSFGTFSSLSHSGLLGVAAGGLVHSDTRLKVKEENDETNTNEDKFKISKGR